MPKKTQKRPSISRAKPSPRTETVSEEPEVQRIPADDVVSALKDISAAIREGQTLMRALMTPAAEAAAMLKDTRTLPLPLVEKLVEKAIAGPPVVMSTVEAKKQAAEAVAVLGEKKGRGRPAKFPCPHCASASKAVAEGQYLCKQGHLWGPAVPAAAVAGVQHIATLPGKAPAALAAVPGVGAVVAQADAPAAVYKPPTPCKGCGKNLDDLKEPHSANCPTLAPAAPAVEQTPAIGAAVKEGGSPPGPAAAPTLDAIRPVAISYATKHGKPALSAVLAAFGSVNLSGVPEESRAALMAKLQEV